MKIPINFRAPFALGIIATISLLAGVVACGPAATAGPPTPTPPISSRTDIFRIVELRELDADQCDAENTHFVMYDADARTYADGFWAWESRDSEGDSVQFEVEGRCFAGKLFDMMKMMPFQPLPKNLAMLPSNPREM